MPDDPILPPPRATLPTFGRLCSKAAKIAGLGEEAFASRAQRAWLAAGREALPAMARAGAPSLGFRFHCQDERRAMGLFDSLLSGSEDPERLGTHTYAACRLSARWTAESAKQGRFTKTRYDGISLEHPCAEQAIKELEAPFGPHFGRAFAIAHEYGHAWQTHFGSPFAVAAYGEAATEPFAAEVALRVAELSRPGRPPPRPAADLAIKIVEEAACDAIGCWALSLLGSGDPLGSAIAFRKASPRCSIEHRTHWLIESIQEEGEPLPRGFDSMAALIGRHCSGPGAQRLPSALREALDSLALLADAP